MIWCLLFSSKWLLMFCIPCHFFHGWQPFRGRVGVWFRLKQRKRWRGDGRSSSSGGRASDGELMKFCSPATHLVLCGLGVARRGLLGTPDAPYACRDVAAVWWWGGAFSSRVMGSRPLVSLGFWTVNFTRVSRVFPQELRISLTASHLGSDNTQQVRFWLTSFPCGQAF